MVATCTLDRVKASLTYLQLTSNIDLPKCYCSY